MLLYSIWVDEGNPSDTRPNNSLGDQAANTAEADNSDMQPGDRILRSGPPGIERAAEDLPPGGGRNELIVEVNLVSVSADDSRLLAPPAPHLRAFSFPESCTPPGRRPRG